MPMMIQSFRPDAQGGKQVTCSGASQNVQVCDAALNGNSVKRSVMVKNRSTTEAARIEVGNAATTVSGTTGYLILPDSAECIPLNDATNVAYIGDGGAGTPALELHAGVGA